MAQSQFTQQEAESTAEAVKEMFAALPKSNRFDYLGHRNAIMLFIDAAKEKAPNETPATAQRARRAAKAGGARRLAQPAHLGYAPPSRRAPCFRWNGENYQPHQAGDCDKVHRVMSHHTRPLRAAAVGEMSIIFSVGRRCGGFYFFRGYTTRLCLGWLAITFVPEDIDTVFIRLTDRTAR